MLTDWKQHVGYVETVSNLVNNVLTLTYKQSLKLIVVEE